MGLLKIRDENRTGAARFFSMTQKLPLEIQMLLCYQMVGSSKEIIPGGQSEMAFRALGKTLAS